MLLTDQYSHIIQELFQRKPSIYGKNLEAMKLLLKHYENPHLAYPSVHVAGTNGKGQVTAKIAYALQHAGYRVGRYISPHLFDYTERISINGQTIPKDGVVDYHTDLDRVSSRLNLHPNFFECTTLHAFRYFRDQEVDIAILETGLGGLYDSTNVITPLVSVITSISFDHMQQLGKTLDEIAAQKAGIIKSGVPIVIGPNARFLPIFEKAKESLCPISLVENQFCFYDAENQMIARKALHLLQDKFQLSTEDIEAGALFCLPCRFERRDGVIYDVAHNPHGFERLAQALSQFYPHQTFRFLIGMSATKDYKRCLEKIKDMARFVHFVQAESGLPVPPFDLSSAWKEMSSCPCAVEESVGEAFQKAKAADDGLLVVCGSFYIMDDARIKSLSLN